MPKKCSSICTKKKSSDECIADPRCKYANGKIRRYCHLSSKYTFDNLCNIITKDSKNQPNILPRTAPLPTSPNLVQPNQQTYIKSRKQTRKKIPLKEYSTSSDKLIKRKPFTIIDTPSYNKDNIKEPLQNSTPEIEIPFLLPKKSKSKSKKKTTKQIPSPRTLKATKLISNLLFKKKDKIRSHFLNTICSDSGYCITLGNEDNKIISFFDYFISFKYAISPVTKIGKDSGNGFIKEIIYEREKYKSYSVLKSQIKDNVSDSLIYEYFVGQYINTLTGRFPLFVKTYGLLKYNDETDYNLSKNRDNLDINLFKLLLKPVLNIDDTITDFSYLCNADSSLHCLLIEHLKNPIYIETICRIGRKEYITPKENYELNFELPNILYQIYFVLNSICDNFTHYDLHYNNVLLYKPKESGYLTYHYHTTGKSPIIFDSQYIVKIIDYGSCFYKYNEERNSNLFYNRLCDAGVCGSRCGENYGFYYIGLPPVPGRDKNDYFINKRKRNASHDLRFAYTIRKNYIVYWLNKYKLNNNTKKLLDILDIIYYKDRYGTPENLNIITYKPNKNVIRNIIQLKKALDILMEDINKLPLSNFLKLMPNYTKLGDLHIYDDGRPMKYEPTR